MGVIVGYLIRALIGGFAVSIVQGIIKMLISVGIGYVVYKGIDVAITSILSHATLNLNNLPFGGILHILKVDTCINILASAAATKFIVSGLSNGAITKFNVKAK